MFGRAIQGRCPRQISISPSVCAKTQRPGRKWFAARWVCSHRLHAGFAANLIEVFNIKHGKNIIPRFRR
jgi:hypothetical protein